MVYLSTKLYNHDRPSDNNASSLDNLIEDNKGNKNELNLMEV